MVDRLLSSQHYGERLAVECGAFPLGQPSTIEQRRVEDSNPQGIYATPVFETGALPVRLTLRFRSRVVMSLFS